MVLAAQVLLFSVAHMHGWAQDGNAKAETLAVQDGPQLAVGHHFTVSFQGPEREELAARAIESLERAYWRVGGTLNTYPATLIEVVLYTTEEFRDITRAPSWAAGSFDGTIRIPMRGALDRPEELDRVLAHEFTHALLKPLSPAGLPTWLNEGAAAALERDNVAWAVDLVRSSGGTAPLAALSGSFSRFSDSQARRAYATSALAVRRLLDANGGVAFFNLIRDLSLGEALAPAFLHRMHEPLPEFSSRLRSDY